MRVLLDACVWGGAKAQLAAEGHDVRWIGDSTADAGDEEVISQACAERRVLVTLDKDFGELAVVRGLPHCGIVRLVDGGSHETSRGLPDGAEALSGRPEPRSTHHGE